MHGSFFALDAHEEPTQLIAIRDLMLEAAGRGKWLTLDEIAGTTEFGEASVSAQLRHLRKARHGRYRVEKRRRRDGETESGRETGLWEYQVSRPHESSPSREGNLAGRRAEELSAIPESTSAEGADAEASARL